MSNKLKKPTKADYAKREHYENNRPEGQMSKEEIDFLNSIDWSGEVFSAGKKLGLKNALGEVVLTPEFEDMKLLSHTDIRMGDRIAAKQNGKWGVVIADGRGTWLIEPEFDYIGYPGTITNVCKNGKWGVLNIQTGDYLIPPECDSVPDSNGFMFVNGIGYYVKEGKTGVIQDSGAFTDPLFDEMEFEPEGPVKVKFNGEWGYINEDNQFTTNEEEAAFYYDI